MFLATGRTNDISMLLCLDNIFDDQTAKVFVNSMQKGVVTLPRLPEINSQMLLQQTAVMGRGCTQ